MKSLMIILGLFLIGLSSAIILYGGDNYSFAVNMTNPAFTVMDNSSNLEGLNVTFNGTHVTLLIQSNMKPDNFTLIFIDNITNTVVNTIRVSSGGGSHTITKVVNNTIIKIQDVPFYIDNTTNVSVESEPIIKEIPVETNKIPGWAWVLLGFETLLIFLLVFKLNKNKNRYNIKPKAKDEKIQTA